jgi:lipoate-protein ligase A
MTEPDWRFINSGYLTGRENMAIDRVMAQHARDNEQRATLRVYGWKPSAISLGYHQPITDIDTSRCKQDSIDVVTRPTGGRAVLHAEELTYSVVIPKQSKYFHDNILKVYEKISYAILRSLSYLDVLLSFDRARRTSKYLNKGEYSTLCYAASAQYEIGYKGRKLVGSAQRRFDDVVLQHGSILIGTRHLDLVDYLAHGNERWRSSVRQYMEKKTICLNELRDHPVNYDELAGAMKSGFENELAITLAEDQLSAQELYSIKHLLAEGKITETI